MGREAHYQHQHRQYQRQARRPLRTIGRAEEETDRNSERVRQRHMHPQTHTHTLIHTCIRWPQIAVVRRFLVGVHSESFSFSLSQLRHIPFLVLSPHPHSHTTLPLVRWSGVLSSSSPTTASSTAPSFCYSCRKSAAASISRMLAPYIPIRRRLSRSRSLPPVEN